MAVGIAIADDCPGPVLFYILGHPHLWWTELIGSLKLGNVWVFVQLIRRPTRPKICCTKTKTLLNLRLPISSVVEWIGNWGDFDLVVLFMLVFGDESAPSATCLSLALARDLPGGASSSFTFGARLQWVLCRHLNVVGLLFSSFRNNPVRNLSVSYKVLDCGSRIAKIDICYFTSYILHFCDCMLKSWKLFCHSN